MNVKNYLWVLPFLSFLSGYYLFSLFYTVKIIQTPALIGTKLHDACKILSQHNLNLRVLAEKEDPDLPEGTILSQTPRAPIKIKQNQSVFCVISTKPKKPKTPILFNKDIAEHFVQLRNLGIRTKAYYLESSYPKNWCIAQLPGPNEQLEDNTIITYVSAGSHKPVIFPDVKHKPVQDVIEFFTSHNIPVDIIHRNQHIKEDHECTQCVVIDQRPLAGSIITLSDEKPLHVQLQA